jgi:arylsulfatase A-like enzyme
VRKKFIVSILLILVFLQKNEFCFSGDSLQDLSGKYKGYNLILIILDALRPDHLSCYNYNKETSPNIDALTKEGFIFTNAFSQTNITLPSVTSLYTSLYPFSHRVFHIFKDKVPERVYTLAQILSMYGYKTACGVLEMMHTRERLKVC